jgi:hypothetical protein
MVHGLAGGVCVLRQPSETSLGLLGERAVSVEVEELAYASHAVAHALPGTGVRGAVVERDEEQRLRMRSSRRSSWTPSCGPPRIWNA